MGPDGRWSVFGASVVVVRMHLLPAGSSFDPRTGRAVLPAGGRTVRPPA